MANVAHASLTGAELHEPKGVEVASLGEVYVADGNGSGNWSNIGTSSFTGMIADFTWPVVQNGWLECNGTDINTTTYGGLYDVMTIQQTGTRSSGSASITSLNSTSNMRVGYYVFGTGIASGTTIVTINSGTQITLSNNASSSGTTTVVVSPWLLNTGTIRLPDLSGRYRRSRTTSTAVGQLQADQNKSHNHSGTTVSATTDSGGNHIHTVSINDPGHTHSVGTSYVGTSVGNVQTGASISVPTLPGILVNQNAATGISAVTQTAGSHTHTLTGTATLPSDGGAEARPLSIVLMTCVKT